MRNVEAHFCARLNEIMQQVELYLKTEAWERVQIAMQELEVAQHLASGKTETHSVATRLAQCIARANEAVTLCDQLPGTDDPELRQIAIQSRIRTAKALDNELALVALKHMSGHTDCQLDKK